MRVVLFVGSHPRHLFLAKTLVEAGSIAGIVIEERENLVPEPYNGLPDLDRQNFIRHFADREQAEQKFFGGLSTPDFIDIPILKISLTELNSAKVVDWVRSLAPDQIISYGVHMLSQDIIGLCPDYAWNIHGGLSPWFRGTATLFWPFYFMKPNWAGMTIHQLSDKLDAGRIIHHSTPKLQRGDGIHDVACRAVVQTAQDLVQIINLRMTGKEFTGSPQGAGGKLFLNSDWNPYQLRVIYQLFDNRLVDMLLDGEIQSPVPALVRALP